MREVDAEWRQREDESPEIADEELHELFDSVTGDAESVDDRATAEFDQAIEDKATPAEVKREREKRIAAEEERKRVIGSLSVCVCVLVCM
jgi:hypothetical protein